MKRKLIIVGTGPSGLTAAIYGARAQLEPLVFEGTQPGGQLTTTTEVENFPGFKDGIMGPELMANMREQAVRFGAEIITEVVTKIDVSKKPYKVFVGETVYETETIIISTGAKARYLGLENENRLIGRGVSTCATCDGFFYRGKEIIVVGGGDSAMEEANFLTKFADKVTLVNRTDSFRASKIMLERTENNPKINILTNKVVVDVLGEEKVNAVLLEDTVTKERTEFKTDGMFLGIGHIPNTDFLKGIIELDDLGYIVVHDDCKTNVDGVFAAGDVKDRLFRQAITSAGDGCKALLLAQHYLEKHQ